MRLNPCSNVSHPRDPNGVAITATRVALTCPVCQRPQGIALVRSTS